MYLWDSTIRLVSLGSLFCSPVVSAGGVVTFCAAECCAAAGGGVAGRGGGDVAAQVSPPAQVLHPPSVSRARQVVRQLRQRHRQPRLPGRPDGTHHRG